MNDFDVYLAMPTLKGLLLALVLLIASPDCSADCFDAAAAYHDVDASLLRGIAWVESRNQAFAIHNNVNGSTDFGVMQINSIHLASLRMFEVDGQKLKDACVNIYVAAWYLRQESDRLGSSVRGLAAYHSRSPILGPAYAEQVQRAASCIRKGIRPGSRGC